MASRKRRTQNLGDLEHRVNRTMTRFSWVSCLLEDGVGRRRSCARDASNIDTDAQRTARPQDLLPPEIVHFEPASLFSLDEEKFVVNFCFSWRGTAGGPPCKEYISHTGKFNVMWLQRKL